MLKDPQHEIANVIEETLSDWLAEFPRYLWSLKDGNFVIRLSDGETSVLDVDDLTNKILAKIGEIILSKKGK